MTEEKIKPGIVPNIYQVYKDGQVTVEGTKYYTIRIVAEKIGRCTATVRTWVKNGYFDGVRDANPFSPRKFYLIPAKQVEEMAVGK